jgi:DNA-binding NtrC family response regulator
LNELVAENRFREDLLYRLNVVNLEVPPLRERKEDIPDLVARYVRYFQPRIPSRVKGFSPEALRAMDGYPWPGNIREMMNIVERSMLLCSGEYVTPEDLPDTMRGCCPTNGIRRDGALPLSVPESDADIVRRPFREARQEVLDTFESQYLVALLRVSRGSVSEAAKRAGMTTRNLFGKLKKHGLNKAEFKFR